MLHSLPPTRQPVFWQPPRFAAGIGLGAYAWRPSLWWTAAAAAFLGVAAYFLRPRFAAWKDREPSAPTCTAPLAFVSMDAVWELGCRAADVFALVLVRFLLR
jgi:hypothetical protein